MQQLARTFYVPHAADKVEVEERERKRNELSADEVAPLPNRCFSGKWYAAVSTLQSPHCSLNIAVSTWQSPHGSLHEAVSIWTLHKA